MKIVDLRVVTQPIGFAIRDAYIDSKTTLSLVAVVRDGRPAVGHAFDSDGRYLDRGYPVVERKIGGTSIAEDRRRVEAVPKLRGPGQRLAVDANGRFDGCVTSPESPGSGVDIRADPYAQMTLAH